jgi:hypothetical protein
MVEYQSLRLAVFAGFAISALIRAISLGEAALSLGEAALLLEPSRLFPACFSARVAARFASIPRNRSVSRLCQGTDGKARKESMP